MVSFKLLFENLQRVTFPTILGQRIPQGGSAIGKTALEVLCPKFRRCKFVN